MRRTLESFFVFALALTPSALGHTGKAIEPHDLWSAWTFEPAVLAGLAISAILYFRGVRPLWRETPGHGVRIWEAASFAVGWLALAVALVSPMHSLGGALFSAHMVQHEILMLVAAPLLVLGRPLLPFVWGLPVSWRRTVGRWSKKSLIQRTWIFVTAPLAAWSLHGIALWTWHAPALFQATLQSEMVHTLQHLSFFLSALLFWWALFHGRERNYGAGVLYIFTTAVHSSILAALLTFSPSLWYPSYALTTFPWGLTPLEDQQLGGLIMWVPAGILYLLAGLAVFIAWLHTSEKSGRERQRYLPTAHSGLMQAIAVAAISVSLSSCGGATAGQAAAAITGGNAARGRDVIQFYGCASCHTISGIPGAHGLVGPPLNGVATRLYIAGSLANTPENLVRWIRNPKTVNEKTAMPNLNVIVGDAHDIAAYLESAAGR
jgi:putative membrane protein